MFFDLGNLDTPAAGKLVADRLQVEAFQRCDHTRLLWLRRQSLLAAE